MFSFNFGKPYKPAKAAEHQNTWTSYKTTKVESYDKLKDKVLTEFAMNIPEWPKESSIIGSFTIIMNTSHDITCLSHHVGVAAITKEEYTRKRSELINSPEWSDAPAWANYKAQDSTGEWYWYAEKPDRTGDGWDISDALYYRDSQELVYELHSVGKIPAGYDWTKSLESREYQEFPEYSEIEDFYSSNNLMDRLISKLKRAQYDNERISHTSRLSNSEIIQGILDNKQFQVLDEINLKWENIDYADIFHLRDSKKIRIVSPMEESEKFKTMKEKKIKSLKDSGFKELDGFTILYSEDPDSRIALVTPGGVTLWLSNEHKEIIEFGLRNS